MSRLLALANLAVVLVAPGLGFVRGTLRRSRPSGPELVLAVAVVSLAYLVLATLALLWAGIFSRLSLTVASLLPLGLLLLARAGPSHAAIRRHTKADIVATSVLVAALTGAILIGPSWSFLMSPNMDAGNYESYANHYATTGDLYFDPIPLLEQGAALEWIECCETWRFHTEDRGNPTRFHAYPMLLAVFKTALADWQASWLVNASIAPLSAIALYLLFRRFLRSASISAALTGLLMATPMFLYYSKQFMTEQLALLAMTALILFLIPPPPPADESEPELSSGPPATGWWLAGGAALLALLTRPDSYVGLAAIGGLLLIGALVERERADRPLALSYLAIATAAVVATAVNLALVDRDYIALGVRDLGQFLPGLGAADGRVAFAALGSGLSAVFAALGFIRLRDRPQRLWNRSPLSSRGLMLVSLGLWLLFVLWNLTLRPMGTPVEVDHDAHNLLRLFMVSTPLGLILLITLSPLVATARGSRAWMTLASIGYLAFMVLFSSHTAPDVWWMRRYLPVLLPAVALVVGIGVQWLTERSRNRYPRVIPGLLISVVLVGTALQGVGMSNLVLRHEVNTEAPTRMIELMAALPPDAPVVVMHRGSRTVLGMGNALRALRPVATLFVKDPADIAVAIKVVQAVAGVAPVVISGDLIDDLIADAMGLKIVHRGTYPRQWADTLALIAENPTSGRHDGYLIYATPGS